MDKTTLHHIVPVSLWWEDFEWNLWKLKEQTHKDLHRTLDIKPTIFSQKIRKIREKTNHKFVTTADEIEMLADMQRLFFDRLSHLPKYVQQLHVVKAMQRLDHYSGVLSKLGGGNLWSPQEHNNHKDTFNSVHEKTISCQKEIVLCIGEQLKKIYAI